MSSCCARTLRKLGLFVTNIFLCWNFFFATPSVLHKKTTAVRAASVHVRNKPKGRNCPLGTIKQQEYKKVRTQRKEKYDKHTARLVGCVA
jgi:hypothetical protein